MWKMIRSFFVDRPEVILWVRETHKGIETFINPKILNLDSAYKRQVIALIDEARFKLTGNKRR